MIPRHLQTNITKATSWYPIIVVTGPRQSGKTTLVKATFPHAHYLSLEKPDQRDFALEDPTGFLARFGSEQVIIDEAQHAPDLFSYIQSVTDETGRLGQYILTGSQNFLLLEKVSQSLAGRCSIHHLLPFSRAELLGCPPASPEEIIAQRIKDLPEPDDMFNTIWTGGYPRIHDKNIPPQNWLENYYQTYIERDVRTIVNVNDLTTFSQFVRLCAGRTGQVINLHAIGNDCGIDQKTARRWLSVLETSFIVKRLNPFHRNYNKRITRSPKLYFLDTGLLCYLLQIRSPQDLATHAMRGAIFESWVISEAYKMYYHLGRQAPLYFFRDSLGNEVDLIIDLGDQVIPVEIKSGQTWNSSFAKGLHWWKNLTGDEKNVSAIIYGGRESFQRSGIKLLSWQLWK